MIWRAVLTFWLGSMLLACAATARDGAEQPVQAEMRIALTFDDIPRNLGAFYDDADKRAAHIIEALGDTQAAFFLNPGKNDDYPGTEQRIAHYVAAGHVIANHTATHPQLRDTGTADYLANVDAAADWLKGREGFRPWFRFPFLDEGGKDKVKRDAIRAGLTERGLTNGYVTVDASDWFYEQAAINAKKDGHTVDMAALRNLYVESHVGSAEFTHGLSLKALGRAPAQVMLLHETDLAALFLDDLIAALKARGWTIISADEAFADPIAQIQTDVPYAQGTLIESIAWERALPAPRWYERNDTKIANELFRTRVLGLEADTTDATTE
ncbi:polysaccharide deacetylase family protein [Pontixanthobacter aestiaquae]|uniref:Chitooligosaccharide deacetylase n=1 Tax=Pontixanthobacter aestiaquae TaxID=1509367 RepID=A0A844Z6W2_9SPHN|nr:polysaccharide deacetylase family protein [Pontixanthobacter aestiaquae]MDN3646407.1 polysaccharide deacetylase family protein [Pontixanthobacter aestiaquae]MXO82603.1 polysaccharide deacetylase family protein [Pontixanthobacter aestiaquae]